MSVDGSTNQDLAREACAMATTWPKYATFLAILSLLMLGYTDSICMLSNKICAGWTVDITAMVRGVPATLLARYLAMDMAL